VLLRLQAPLLHGEWDQLGAGQTFLEHATQEQQHADMVAQRITQLNGEPNLDPRDIASRSHSEYVSGTGLTAMLKEDLYAERIAVETYSEIVDG
jgi:bacterioferritin